MTEPTMPHEMIDTVVAALGDGPVLTTDQTQLLLILLDPANDPSESALTFRDVLEELDAFSGSDLDEASTVGGILATYHDRRTGNTGQFVFEHVRDSDGCVTSYNVMSATGPAGIWLTASADAKYLFGDRYDVRGLRAALRIAETLRADYERIPHWPDTVVALNRAADDVTDLHPDGELVRDAANLVVNAALHYLDHPGDDLTAAITAQYGDQDVAEVIHQISDPDD